MISVDMHDIRVAEHRNHRAFAGQSKFASIGLMDGENRLNLFISKEHTIDAAKELIEALQASIDFMENGDV